MQKPSPVAKAIRGFDRPLTIRVRVNRREHEAFKAAADLAGITASSWCRMVLRMEAIARLTAAGTKVDL